MRLPVINPKRKSKPKPEPLRVLCVPSSFCLRCPVEDRKLVCFFKQPRPTST